VSGRAGLAMAMPAPPRSTARPGLIAITASPLPPDHAPPPFPVLATPAHPQAAPPRAAHADAIRPPLRGGQAGTDGRNQAGTDGRGPGCVTDGMGCVRQWMGRPAEEVRER
jgi:hypothetical protein